jgi:hypothetical protein
MWWERWVKKQLQYLIRQEETERRTNHRLMERHLLECIFATLRSTAPETEKPLAPQRYEATLVCLYAVLRNKILLDTHEHNNIVGEEPSVVHVLKVLRRREDRVIWEGMDLHGNNYTSLHYIAATFVSYLSNKYPIDVDRPSLASLQNLIYPRTQQHMLRFWNIPLSLTASHCVACWRST